MKKLGSKTFRADIFECDGEGREGKHYHVEIVGVASAYGNGPDNVEGDAPITKGTGFDPDQALGNAVLKMSCKCIENSEHYKFPIVPGAKRVENTAKDPRRGGGIQDMDKLMDILMDGRGPGGQRY